MNFGLPYMGSKNDIAPWVVNHLPKATHLYDLFAGGCAVTHMAMLTQRFQFYHVNDITPMAQLFVDAVRGKYHNEKRWIDRETFMANKSTDMYIRTCWSFGNNGEDYMYSKEIEPWKKALHYARVYRDFSLFEAFGIHTDGTRADITKHHAEYKERYIRWYLKNVLSDEDYDRLKAMQEQDIERGEEELRQYLLDALKASGLTQSEVGRRLGTQMQGHYFGRSQWAFPTREEYNKMREFMPLPLAYEEVYGLQQLRKNIQSLQSLQSLQRLQSLESLESLQRLQRLQRLSERYPSVSVGDYQAVEIEPDSVIYCDPPYKGTCGYNKSNGVEAFDHERFYDWCRRQTVPTLISEYDMPPDFVCIDEIRKSVRLSATSRGKANERLFCPKHQEHLFKTNKQLTLFF